MNQIQDLNQLKDIRVNAVNKLFAMLPNYEVAKRFADDLGCDIEEALTIANDLVPNLDIYIKIKDNYYHIYKYGLLRNEYKAKQLYSHETKANDGNNTIKWYKGTETLSNYRLKDAEIVTKEEYEAIYAIAE
jgi:hypothetical protein